MMTRNIGMKSLESLTLLACVLTLTYAACHCKDGCSSDDVVCQECHDGFHGNRCRSSCSDTCRSLDGVVACDKDSGRCLNGCIDRYYGDTCQFTCPFGCRRCISDTNCSVCEDNWRWGNRCQAPCSDTCKPLDGVVACAKDSGRCLNGCIDGYYGDTCDISCPPGCRRCTSDTNCSVCEGNTRWGDMCQKRCSWRCEDECNISGVCDRCYFDILELDVQGYYGDQCNHACNEAIPDCLECTRDGQKCLVCKSAKYGEQCEMTCPDHCMLCSSALNCSMCMYGYYGDVCDQVCRPNCQYRRCNPQGRCLRCADVFFGERCELACPDHCFECSSALNCSRCEPGYYGEVCDQVCPVGCKDEECDIQGRCLQCAEGIFGERCEMACPDHCLECSSALNCSQCEPGYYGDVCDQVCQVGCKDNKCDIQGRCLQCEAGKFGDTCDKQCNEFCKTWFDWSVCGRTDGLCHYCAEGFYGRHCEQNCSSNCVGGCNKDSGECVGCPSGYYGINSCDMKCPFNCLYCSRVNGSCYFCEEGFYGNRCEHNCDKNCTGNGFLNGTFCIITNGHCIGCSHGLYGIYCENTCSMNCRSYLGGGLRYCDQESGNCTSGCKDGWFGETCQSNCGNCFGGRCNRQDGLCTLGCKDGWFGETCLGNCGNCFGGRCNWKDGMCILGCRDGWFGESCLKNCSNCLGGRCNQTVGMCTLGCKDGWFDGTCQSNCSNCLGGRCNQTDGMCTLGCVPGFIGEHCQEEQKQVELGESGPDIEAILGIALPAVVFLGSLLGVVIGVYMYNARKRRRQAGDMEASTGGGQEIPLHTLGHGAGAKGNSAPCANTNAVAVDLQEESSDPNIEVVADLQLYKDRLLSDGRDTPVYEGVFEDSIPVAVKRITLTLPQYAEELSEHVKILREVETLRTLPGHKHKNIVRYLKSVQTPHFLYIAFELCQGTLEAYVDPQKSWSKQLPWKDVLTQMTKGLQFLHDNANVAHRDLKPSNVLLCKSMFETKVVLADFGHSKVMVNMRCSMTGTTGSVGWIAPEVETTEGHYYTESDIFSLGCLFYFVATKGYHPFGKYPLQRQNNISHSDSDLSILQPYLECLRELITDMIQSQRNDRPRAELVSQHPSLLADEVIMDFLHKASNKINGYPLSQQNILEDPTIIPGGSWTKLLPVNTQAHLSIYRLPRQKQPMFKGREGSVRHLLRAIRNCSEHFQDLPAAVRAEMGASTPDHVQFWLGLYPWLLTHVYGNMKSDKSLMDSIRKA